MSYKLNLQSNNTQLSSNNTDLQNLIDQANNLPDVAEQATPEISVNSSGLITATAGDKSATKQLTIQTAKTVTPTTTNQTAVASGRYTTGAVTVKGDSNLVAENIKSGVSIFGVEGTLEEGSGSGEAAEWSENEDAIVTRTLSVYTNDRVTTIGSYAFYDCSSLTSVSFPECTTINYFAFYGCSSLTSVSFPACTTIGNSVFHNCKSLTSVSFPECTTIGGHAFYGCSSLTSVSFPECTTINYYAFYNCKPLTSVSFPACTVISSYAFRSCGLISAYFPACKIIGSQAFAYCKFTSVSFPACRTIGNSVFFYCYNLTSLYLTGSSLCTLSNSNAFISTPIGGYSTSAGCYGSIYVPQSLLASYQAATNWAYFSSRFVGV